MLYIKTTDERVYEWEWGSNYVCYLHPSFNYVNVYSEGLRSKYIYSIRATDGELANIVSKFYNIPKYKHSDINNECCWFGDDAKFIAVAIGASKE